MIHRRDVADISACEEQQVLAQYGLGPGDLLGQGTEAKVYALDGERVLKIYAGQQQRPALETLADFYRRLDTTTLPYALPRIHDIHPHGDLPAVVERRIDGTPMQEYVSPGDTELEGLYLDTVTALAQVKITPPLDRFMLLESPAAAAEASRPRDWHAFLTSLISRRLPAVLPLLRQDIPGIDTRVDALLAQFAEPTAAPSASSTETSTRATSSCATGRP